MRRMPEAKHRSCLGHCRPDLVVRGSRISPWASCARK